MKRVYRLTLALILSMFCVTLFAQQTGNTSCEICHSNSDWFDEEHIEFVDRAHGVHQEVGLTCHDCHGGNPDPELADDPGAMDPDYEPHPYIGAPARTEIPEFCGRCHSSLEYMRRFKPDARVDQVREYWTSDHGQALQEGDENVATCIDCHGAHEILNVDNADARVYPTHVADTCATCHSDPEYMEGYTDPHGNPLPVNQVSKWQRSVHAAAMFEKGDLTAPTCNDCHGNHGATPPGIESVAFVCGQCHGREAELFRDSPKLDAFENHNEYLAGGTTCDTCHEPFPSHIAEIRQFSECITCHRNHAVVRPTIAMLGALPPTPCSFCHEPDTEHAELEAVLENYQTEKQRLVAEADEMGLDEEATFNWLVEQAKQLEFHTTLGQEDERVMRPEFSRLFEKFRIGKTVYSYEDPVTGEPVTE
ncbi:MAG: cytochrome c3 family protein, partial [Thermoanaerobaculia bacterium]|nr:cytochrome c3 family protein [Thermoanaerobaculia bacterium]